MQKLILLLTITILTFGNQSFAKDKTSKNSQKFSFVFMTDIHVEPELNADKGLMRAVNLVNRIKPEFVLTGGDNIMDALGQNYGRSDSLYNLYTSIMKNLQMPVYHGMGNHEIFGLYEKSGVSPDNPFYGKKLYEDRLAKRYYSFDHKNWHFIVLDGIGLTEDHHYYGVIDREQIEWLKKELEKTGKEKPIAVCTHIPLLSIGSQIMEGPTKGMGESTIITNADKIIPLLEKYNVKLVLQGHLHFLEDINYNGIHYITGGAVCSNWWKGKRYGMEEGFLEIHVDGEKFDWKYVDYGWKPEQMN